MTTTYLLAHPFVASVFMKHFVEAQPAIQAPKPPMVPILRAVQLPQSSAIDMRETLIEARGLIDRGWTQGVQYDVLADGSSVYCTLGAAAAAVVNLFGRVHDANWRERLVNDVIAVLYENIRTLPASRTTIALLGAGLAHDPQTKAYTVMHYNDYSDSKARVLALFDRAIASVPVPYVPESARALVQA